MNYEFKELSLPPLPHKLSSPPTTPMRLCVATGNSRVLGPTQPVNWNAISRFFNCQSILTTPTKPPTSPFAGVDDDTRHCQLLAGIMVQVPLYVVCTDYTCIVCVNRKELVGRGKHIIFIRLLIKPAPSYAIQQRPQSCIKMWPPTYLSIPPPKAQHVVGILMGSPSERFVIHHPVRSFERVFR